MRNVELIIIGLLIGLFALLWLKPVKVETFNNHTKEIQQVLVRDTIRKVDTVYKEVVVTKTKTTVAPAVSIGRKLVRAYDIEVENDAFDINGYQFDADKDGVLYCEGNITFELEEYETDEGPAADTSNYVCDGDWFLKFKEKI